MANLSHTYSEDFFDVSSDGITFYGSGSIEINTTFNVANSNASESSTSSFSSSNSSSNSTFSSSTTGFSSSGSSNLTFGNISVNDMDSVGYGLSSDETQSSPNASVSLDNSRQGSVSIDISQVEAEIDRINRYCSEVVSNISPDTSASLTSTPRMVRRDFRSVNAPVEVIDLLHVDDSIPRTAANRVPEAVIDLCTPSRPRYPTVTIDLDDSDCVPSNRRRNHGSSSTPTTARAPSAINSAPSSPKRKRNDQNVSSDDVYKCPVCLEGVRQREPWSTKCGHVFCRQCIETAIRSTHKCPMCNKKLTLRQTTRIYL